MRTMTRLFLCAVHSLLIHSLSHCSAAVDSELQSIVLSSPPDNTRGGTKAFRPSSPWSSIRGLSFQRQRRVESSEVFGTAEVFHRTLELERKRGRHRLKRDTKDGELLSSEDGEQIAELSHCPTPTHPHVCIQSMFDGYRSISGLCNNRRNPEWGAANVALVRWLPAEYDDGEGEPRGWNQQRHHNDFQLPLPRRVSQEILRSYSKQKDDQYSQLLVEWGQYIDHDITFTPQSSSSTLDTQCLTTCESDHSCFPMKVENALTGARRCLPFYRSAPHCAVSAGSGLGRSLQRQQINAITSFIDASVVYGHTPRLQSVLRDLSKRNGKLSVNNGFQDAQQRAYLPFVGLQPSPCRQDGRGGRVECFSAGDTRVNEGLPLIMLHTLWLREHNRIAETLKALNDHWSPEMIYQESRKIIGALHQIITMRDYVPKIIGLESFQRYIGPYTGYDPSVDPSASNVFATAAFRFGHATISPVLRRLNESFQEDERFPSLRLHDTFFTPWRIVKEGGIDPVLRGSVGSAASAVSGDLLVSDEVTERLVVLNALQRLDLAALNLQRGRDHGLPGYNAWRTFCGLTPVKTLDHLTKVVGMRRIAEKVLSLYKDGDNIDVWLGGLVERVQNGSRTGPLFACLIAKQMKALRDGDRFWWENEGTFSRQQKEELVKFSLSRLICDNSNMDEVPPDSFKRGTFPSDLVSCDHIPSVRLEAWRERKSEDVEKCGCPGQTEHGDYVLSSASGRLLALYSCYHGYQLNTSAVVECVHHQWMSRPPLCSPTPSD